MDLVAQIDDRSAKGIAAAIGRLVSAGELQPGNRLPTAVSNTGYPPVPGLK